MEMYLQQTLRFPEVLSQVQMYQRKLLNIHKIYIHAWVLNTVTKYQMSDQAVPEEVKNHVIKEILWAAAAEEADFCERLLPAQDVSIICDKK